MSDDEPQLLYASASTPANRFARRTKIVRVLCWLVILALVGIPIYPLVTDREFAPRRWWREQRNNRKAARDAAERKAALERAYQACLSYRAEPGSKVYMEGETDGRGSTQSVGHIYSNTHVIRELFVHIPIPARNYLRGSGHDTVAFMGARATPQRERRLVVVFLYVDVNRTVLRSVHGERTLRFTADIDPHRNTNPADPAINRVEQRFGFDDVVEILAGQPDPADASRFEIPLIVNGARRVIRGQLLPDDTVRLDSPAAPTTLPAERTPPGVPQ